LAAPAPRGRRSLLCRASRRSRTRTASTWDGTAFSDVRVEARTDAELLLDPLLDLVGHVGVSTQVRPRVLLALAELISVVGVPGARLAHDPLLDTEVDKAALPAYPDSVQDVELG